ncbi:MAG TPA: AAA family ATPase [Actinomycetota bacterium]|nr:AAA family ATPase [Actinomycetota bacterium]
MDLKQYIAASAPMFDDPPAVSREAFQACAALLAAGEPSGLERLAAYLGWRREEVTALAEQGRAFRSTAPPTLRALIAAGHTEQVETYALFMVQVTRLACLQFAAGDAGASRAASAIAATVTRTAPISNTRLEPAAPDPQPTAPDPKPTEQSLRPDMTAVGRALDDLERLVGLEEAKREINQQVQLIRIAQLRETAGLRNPTVSRHLVFVGNPGTGKTTVARIVGRIYTALGVVRNGQLVETDASGLVAGYVGQTALKTQEQIDKALGGILFVDEAYGLTRNDFGVEAVDTLVKAMEDHRHDLVVIVAGYPDNMREFISSNPGLESRFPVTVAFADYSPDELLLILQRMCADADYQLAEDAQVPVRQVLEGLTGESDFGNARTVRNLFEAAVREHAWRLRDVTEVSVEQMRTLGADDFAAAVAPE